MTLEAPLRRNYPAGKHCILSYLAACGASYIKRRGTCFTAVFRLTEDDIQDWRKDVPVDICIQFHQWIFELGEPFQQEMFIEKLRLVGVDIFHDSRG